MLVTVEDIGFCRFGVIAFHQSFFDFILDFFYGRDFFGRFPQAGDDHQRDGPGHGGYIPGFHFARSHKGFGYCILNFFLVKRNRDAVAFYYIFKITHNPFLFSTYALQNFFHSAIQQPAFEPDWPVHR